MFDPGSVVECFSDMSSSLVEDSGWCSHRELGWCRCCSAPGDYTPCRSPSEILEKLIFDIFICEWTLRFYKSTCTVKEIPNFWCNAEDTKGKPTDDKEKEKSKILWKHWMSPDTEGDADSKQNLVCFRLIYPRVLSLWSVSLRKTICFSKHFKGLFCY